MTAETDDFSGGQITRTSVAADLLAVDFATIYPLAGPDRGRGSEAGRHARSSSSTSSCPTGASPASSPGLGLLPPGEFSEPVIRHFDLTEGDTTELCPGVAHPDRAVLRDDGRAGRGMHDVHIAPPHAGGGNIDNRHLTRGTTLYLPIAVEGGCSRSATPTRPRATARSPSRDRVRRWRRAFRLDVMHGVSIPGPQLRRAPGSLTPRVDADGWYATFGVEPDLMVGRRPPCAR